MPYLQENFANSQELKNEIEPFLVALKTLSASTERFSINDTSKQKLQQLTVNYLDLSMNVRAQQHIKINAIANAQEINVVSFLIDLRDIFIALDFLFTAYLNLASDAK